ncbi:MAG: tagatose-6-phosphate kinase [Desulfobacterium sp.]|nr:tagatose-6-phosphate kinase [Desulfobacterium sp.]MBU3948493.1 class II D-tagatose-bisphosphate aldolase, non-catalytic subunit [Pseudomonadota bacterium]MBU4036006.1 class II D-tagatose-bisphosphate aldolase, non-catalytic subunit [Pseudomonadota bacterium]
MINERLKRFMDNRCCTLLGVGPMSKNCVDATIELSNDYEIPLIIIASRRQIEAEDFGGGYVNNWSTERFAEYVIEHDQKGKIILARDHGGPWQNNFEKEQKLSLRNAMESAKKSFQVDIESGFEMIHIDASVDIYSDLSINETLLRIFDLYEFCWSIAQQEKRKIIFEIGSEEQSGSNHNQHDVEYVISETINFCNKNNLPKPSFVVIQTGTKVLETRNVGTFDTPFRIKGELPSEIEIPKMLDICNKYDIFLKQHNTDYLSDEALAWHPKLGIHSANVAPEFGVVETLAFIEILKEYKLTDLVEKFVKLSYESKKWEKWMSAESKAGEIEKAVIAGHYVFSDPEFIEIKLHAKTELQNHNIDLDEYLKSKVKKSIMRYLVNFRLVGR